MQVSVVRRQAPVFEAREYGLAERAKMLCGVAFAAHFAVWREALDAQRRNDVVPESYLVAMRSVVAREAAAGSISGEDAVAAAVAIAVLGTQPAAHAALQLLQDLSALGNMAPEILRVAISLGAPSRAALAQARLDLLSMSRTGTQNERTAVRCLLGETYLARGGAPANEAIAFRLFMAAADENCPAAAAAHFHLGVWYAQEGTEADLLLANHHFERGAQLGCAHCLRGLGEIHQSSDSSFAQELLELADLTEGGPPPVRYQRL